ncbi:MAG TPA: hypothetical protein VHJ38_19670 [Nitrososphaeraceae archaeon]|nr:hypothetical protein [Nitrososphaeraceae archaeon]
MNKIVSSKRSSTIFLTIVLVIGTITVFSPLSASSFMTAEVEENNMYVVWADTYSSDTFIAVSNDNGQTFSTPIIINNNAEGSVITNEQYLLDYLFFFYSISTSFFLL